MNRIALALVLFLAAGSLWSENKDLVAYFDANKVVISVGQGGMTLSYKGLSSGVQFGVSPTIGDVLSLYPDSRASYEAYLETNRRGNIMYWVGFAAIMASPVLLNQQLTDALLGTNPTAFSDGMPLVTGLYAGGLILAMLGGGTISESWQNLSTAVAQYNDDVLNVYTPRF